MLFNVKSLLVSALALGTIANPLPYASNLIKRSETALNQFLYDLLTYLPAVHADINDVTTVIADFEQLLADLLGIQTTENELGNPCTEWTIIFARGTSETGNVGVLVGPPLFWALQDLVGTSALTIQGVNNYPASVPQYLEGGSPSGSADMASQIKAAVAQCPNTKLIVSGYSQGCQVVHNAIGQISADVASHISSVLLFGDPDDGTPLPNVAASKVLTICHSGDDICQDGILILPQHLTYGENAPQAAAFAVAAAA